MGKANSPWGTAYKEGLPTTAVNDQVFIPQEVVPALNTGVIDVKTGQWEGVLVSDKQFRIDDTHEAIPNSGVTLSPQSQPDYIDMTGYSDLLFAIKPSNGGNYACTAVMGPDHNYYANLDIIVANSTLVGSVDPPSDDFNTIFSDSAQSLQSDKWNVFIIQKRLANQKLLQMRVTNNSGADSNIQLAFLRIV